MRSRPITWLVISLICFLGAVYFWRLGNQWAEEEKTRKLQSSPASAEDSRAPQQPGNSPVRLLSTAGTLNQVNSPGVDPQKKRGDWTKYRIRNTDAPLSEMIRSSRAVLLENATLDATQPIGARIPAHLRAPGNSGAHIVQFANPITTQDRAAIEASGGQIISYIPNNALLVRGGNSLSGSERVQAVLPFEPFYKLKGPLLEIAVEQNPLPAEAELRVLLFQDARESTLEKIVASGAQVVTEERSPFGPVVRVKPAVDSLPLLAGLDGVQALEIARARIAANDLSRERTGVASNSVTEFNYLGLTGKGVMVNLNDTGVDATHPDLLGRVFFDVPFAGLDSNGHGTHVAGVIASSGAQSLTVTNAVGSIMPPTNGQFRGMAPGAQLFVMPAIPELGPLVPDAYLQETAARTNAFISNNSWHYGIGSDYDLAAASYDAAVRDALPEMTGSQPVLFVFPTGNEGFGNDSGQGGVPDSIPSPATAKNVITVGSIEHLRDITNDVWKCTSFFGDTNANCVTNQPWQGMTDSRDQVAGFSGRGNVGIGIEGDFGRFKPDVVAPGTFVVSTRSTHWNTAAYYNSSNYTYQVFEDQTLQAGDLAEYSIFVPDNAVAVFLQLGSANTNLALPIFVKQADIARPDDHDFLRTNSVQMPPDNGPELTPRGTDWFYTVGNPTLGEVRFNILTTIITTNDNGNYFEVLSNLNTALGPFYRYESGSSMSAAQVSGTLALMQEFFEQRLGLTNSPALMKALLINGARSVGNLYDFQVQSPVNYQGWGLVNLPNSLPGALSNIVTGLASPIHAFDQSPTNALATGQRHTRSMALTPAAQAQPLRFTLVWTDPPGNPLASMKLVNNLDLVVTNLDTGEVYYGNNMPAGFDYTRAWDTNVAPTLDVVNNVENVFIAAPVGTNYSVTVIGRQVNVNAVPGHPNDVVQDYALVISSNPRLSDALTLTTSPLLGSTQPNVTVVSNQFAAGQRVSGAFLQDQRVGANTPLLGTTNGMTNQWHFYVLTNDNANFTNAAFITFIPANLGIPRMGTREWDVENATRVEADIDLYVSTDPAITNLSPGAIASARRSRSQGGTEYVYLTNVPNAATYYVAVKSEDQQAANYGFIGMFSDLPFQQGPYVQGWPLYQDIPDGSPENPGGSLFLFPALEEKQLRRVVVTNLTLMHQMPGDLLMNLSHERKFVVLHNHTCVQIGQGCATNYNYVYEDNGEGDFPGSKQSDGPGDLRDFIGVRGVGPWFLTVVDNAPVHTGRVANVWLKLEPQDLDEDGVDRSVAAGRFTYDFVDVPINATNLTICLSNSLPLQIYLRRDALPSLTEYDEVATINPMGGCMSLGSTDLPPLAPGRYYIGVFNPNTVTVRYNIRVKVDLDLAGIRPDEFTSLGTVPLKDDAVTYDTMLVTNNQRIARVDVGLRVDHPRISDMVFHLISPQGTRVLLFENRGGTTTSGIGSGATITNVMPQTSSGSYQSATNVINVGQNRGTLLIGYDFFNLPDVMQVEYDNQVIFNSGLTGGSGQFTIPFGPGSSTAVTVIMNPSGNSDTNTLWEYQATVVTREYDFFVLTDDTNRAAGPVKFASPPFGNTSSGVNRTTYWQEGFENGSPGNKPPGSDYFSDGWFLVSGDVDLLQDGFSGYKSHTGIQALDLNGWSTGSVSNRFSLPSLQIYTLALAYARNPDSVGRGVVPRANVRLNGQPLGTLMPDQQNAWSDVMWQTTTFSFQGNPGTNTIELLSLTADASGVLVDSFEVYTESVVSISNYYHPEEPLEAFVGENAQGIWRLEAWDTRAGAWLTTTELVAWQLAFVFERTSPRPISLEHGVPRTNSIPPGEIAYFTVDVPLWAQFATNTLVYASGPVDLYFNQLVPPTGSGPGDFTLLANATSGVGNPVLSTNSTPPLLPGMRYYLGVKNNGTTEVTAAVQVEFNLTPLTNAVPYLGSTGGSALPRYFYFDVSPNATAVSFDLANMTGNLDLVARRGVPLPTANNYDHGSFNPGASDDTIILFTNSNPLPLVPGRYYLGVLNTGSGNTSYELTATEYTNVFPAIITLFNGVTRAGTNSAGLNSTNDYYRFVVSPNAVGALFEVTEPTGDVILVARRGLPLPDNSSYDLSSDNPGIEPETIKFYTNSVPVALQPGEWFLTVVNVSGAPVSYNITATELYEPPPIIIVITDRFITTNSFCLTWNSIIGLTYYVEGLSDIASTNWTTLSEPIVATDSETTWCLGLPSQYQFFRVLVGLPSGGARVTIDSIVRTAAGVEIRWLGPAGATFTVEWSASIVGPWTEFSTKATSSTGDFLFIDDGTETGGAQGLFYRVKQDLP